MSGDHTIETYPSGVEIDFADLAAADFRIEDIAHHLACEPRFCGATPWVYPVASHSLVVSLLCELHPDADAADPMRGLLHDASEYVLKDVAGPFKRMPEMAGYVKVQRECDRLIAEHFGVGTFDTPIVKGADAEALIMEQVLIRKKTTSLKPPTFHPRARALLEYLYAMNSPATVRVRFLQRFEQLKDALAG